MWNPVYISRHLDTTDRIAAAAILRDRATVWAASCTGTADLLAAVGIVQWARALFAAEVANA